MGNKLFASFKRFLKKIIPDIILFTWIFPIRDFIKFKIIYFRYWEKNRRNLKLKKGIIFISGESHTPGHVYRISRYMETYQGFGISAEWLEPEVIYANPKLIDNCQILIIWRIPMNRHLNMVINRAKSNNIIAIYDLDDYMFDPTIAIPEITDAIRFKGIDIKYIKDLYANMYNVIKECNIVTSPTEFLSTRMEEILTHPTYTLPNGYDYETLLQSNNIIKNPKSNDTLIRIGYAGGTQTHQKDFELVVHSIAEIFKEYPSVRLVIFSDVLKIEEFPILSNYNSRIESRQMVPLNELQYEIARFDINIAPLKINPFNEAKSELKYFEAALLEIPTIASPTQPYKGVINHGKNGLLAHDSNQWYESIKKLIDDSDLRKTIGKTARRHVLWHFSPEHRNHQTFEFLNRAKIIKNIEINHPSLREKTYKFSVDYCSSIRESKVSYPDVVDYEILKEYKSGRNSYAGVVIPLYNYEKYILDALESVKNQTLKDLDLVVVDDCSTDGSLQLVVEWMEKNEECFNNCSILKNKINSKLSAARNTGFDYINSIWVMQLDADNQLLPTCLEECLNVIKNSGAEMVYPQLELFGDDKVYIYISYDSTRLSIAPWDPENLARQNYIDAMALVSKAAWVKVGGYDVSMIFGLEDWDLWLRFIEQGFFGVHIPKILARYRVHKNSMLRNETTDNFNHIRRYLVEKHPWIKI